MWLKKWEKKVKIEERAARKKNCGAVELWRMLNFFFWHIFLFYCYFSPVICEYVYVKCVRQGTICLPLGEQKAKEKKEREVNCGDQFREEWERVVRDDPTAVELVTCRQ